MAATIAAPSSLADQVEAVHNNSMGHLTLSPKYVGKFLDTECNDKQPEETYRQYLTRRQGKTFSNTKWKNLSSSLSLISSSNEMDMTSLYSLFKVIFKVKNDNRDKSGLMSKLKALKDLRNDVMHDAAAATDPGAMAKLQDALMSFIREAGTFYSFSTERIQELQQELRDDIKAGFAQGKKRLLYARTCAVRDGRSSIEEFLRKNFKSENLLFNLGVVNRSIVYHALEIKLTDEIEPEAFPYTEIFERDEELIVVSGSAGTGKSTMLENIALQFVDPQSCTVPQLKDFQLLVYVQCRDRETKTLGEVVKQQFSDVCTKLGVEMMIEVLKHLRVLFLIDGFDEYDKSMTVLEEVVKIPGQAKRRVIITTRPHALPKLRRLLKNHSSYITCEIVPLTELEQQRHFLAKYEKHLPGATAKGSLLSTFENLNDSVRSLFTEPLKLLRFCDVFVTSPDKISKWTTPNHASKDIFLLYRTLVEEKLSNTHDCDLNIVVSDLFQIIAEAAFGFLRSNTLTFTKEQVEQIQRKCRLKLKEDHGITDINIEYFLSSVLKIKNLFSKAEVTTYSFAHKTDEEYFAAQYVIQQITESRESLKEILHGEMQGKITLDETETEVGEEHDEGSTPPLQPFLEVLQFVVQDLNDRHPSLPKARWSQILEALQEAGATVDTWRDLVLSCPDQAFVVQKAAEAALAEDDWELRTGRDVAAVAQMLQYAQPRRLEVNMLPEDLRRTCWTDVIRARNGNIELFLPDDPCDDLIAPLQNSRCRLVDFRGCVTTAESVKVLASVAAPASELRLTLRGPLGLSALEGKCVTLGVSTAPFSMDEKCEIKAPLPAKPPPKLKVDYHDQPTSWGAVASTVLTLAPRGGRFREITLLMDHHSTDWERSRLVVALQRRGIRTEVEAEGYSCHFRDSGDTKLVLTDRVTDQLAKFSDLIDHVAQCSKRTSWPHQAVLEAAGANFRTWMELVRECSANERVVKGAAEAALLEDEWWMETSREATAVALMLQHAQPRHLRVQMSAADMRETCWEHVAQRRVGDIALLLNSLLEQDYTIHYIPCDDLVKPLKNSRCQLVEFEGCLSTAAGVAALAAVSTLSMKLRVYLKQPLSLTDLQGKYEKLEVWTRPFPVNDEGDGSTCLPAQPLPELYLQLVPEDERKAVAHTVQTLAPAGGRYKRLTLANCYVGDATLEMLVVDLREKGIRTTGEGRTRWERERREVILHILD